MTLKAIKKAKRKTSKKKSNSSPAATPEKFDAPPARLTRKIPVLSITAPPQARETFDEGALLELSRSIGEIGALQPIVVIETAADSGKYDLIAGERRLRATKLGNINKDTMILATVYAAGSLNERDIARMRIAENFQRVDLNRIETARAMEAYRLAGAAIPEIAASVHKSVDFVRDHLRLLDLDLNIQPHVASGRIPIKQAVMIAAVGDPHTQQNIAKNAMNPSVQFHHRDQSLAEIAAGSDYMSPMKELREAIQGIIKSLKPCKWPMDAEYAGARPCIACPHNTLTEPRQWTLLNVKGKQGNCTNEQCFIAKTRAWEKDPIKLAADRKLHAAALKAKQKAEKEAAKNAETPAEPGGDMIANDQTERESADYLYHNALTDYGEQIIEEIVNYLDNDNTIIPEDALNCVLRVFDLDPRGECEFEISAERAEPKRQYVAQVVESFNNSAAVISPPQDLAANILFFIRDNNMPCLRPQIRADEDLAIAANDMITALRALAVRWNVAIDQPPKFEDFKDDPDQPAEPK